MYYERKISILRTYPLVWQASFACFIIAGITGILYRVGIIGWLPGNLSLQNIRHAHSHLMFFGWAVPLPLYVWLLKSADEATTNSRAVTTMYWSVLASLFFGILSYPFFLLYGYRSVEIGMASLPLSVIMSGLVMITWYIFMAGYWQVRKNNNLRDNYSWFEGSLVMLLVSSLGAWGVAMVQAIDPEAQLMMKVLTHFFLAVFVEGWVLLVVLAVVFDILPADQRRLPVPEGILIGFIAIGAPLTFAYGISETLLTSTLLSIARAGGLLVGIGTLLALYPFVRWKGLKKSILIWPVCFLLLKVFLQLGASVLPSELWLSDHALRILYLHILLLGAFSLGIVGWLHKQKDLNSIQFLWYAGSVVLVLLSLVTMTRFWPTNWGASGIFYLATAAAILPVIALAFEWYNLKSVSNSSTNERYYK